MTYLSHHSSLDEQGKTTRRSTSCHKAQTGLLDQPSPASDSWFTIFPSYPIFPLVLFSVSTSQAVSLHDSLLWKSVDLREMLLRFFLDAQKLIWAATVGKAHVTLSSFFQALSQPFTGQSTSQSSRVLFCNSLTESSITYLYSNTNKTIKKWW